MLPSLTEVLGLTKSKIISHCVVIKSKQFLKMSVYVALIHMLLFKLYLLMTFACFLS